MKNEKRILDLEEKIKLHESRMKRGNWGIGYTKAYLAEEKNKTLPIVLLVSSFQSEIIGVESRWYMKPSFLIDSSTKKKRSFLEERWELVCSKSRFKLSSWIIKARQQGYNRRTINVYKITP